MAENKASMCLSKEASAFNPTTIMNEEKGIYFTFTSDMGKIAEILPPPLEPAFPVVSGYIVNIDNPTFAEPYKEAMLSVYVKHEGIVGMYPVCSLLSGPGAGMAALQGRERFGIPQKMCEREDCIKIERNGDVLRGTAVRKGVTLLDVSIKLGKYNNPTTATFYSNVAPGEKTPGLSFSCAPVIEPDGTGSDHFVHVNLLQNVSECAYRVWEPGEVTVRLLSSDDDAWGHFPVIENMGGAYSENNLEMKDLYLAAQLNTDDAIPMLLKARYDIASLKEG